MTGQHARPRFNWAAFRLACVICCGLFLAGVALYELAQIITS